MKIAQFKTIHPVKKLRDNLGLNQHDFGILIGLAYTSVCRVELFQASIGYNVCIRTGDVCNFDGRDFFQCCCAAQREAEKEVKAFVKLQLENAIKKGKISYL